MIPEHLHNREAERLLLGSIIRDSATDDAAGFWEASSIIRAEDFYNAAHQILWLAFASLAESGQKIEPLTVGNFVARAQQTEEIGGIRTIFELFAGAAAASNIAFHARLIREKADLRRYLRIGEEIAAKAKARSRADRPRSRTAADSALIVRSRSRSLEVAADRPSRSSWRWRSGRGAPRTLRTWRNVRRLDALAEAEHAHGGPAGRRTIRPRGRPKAFGRAALRG